MMSSQIEQTGIAIPVKAPRILIVEDERVVARSLSKQLETLGYQVAAVVSSGEQAVQVAGELRPHLVLMDISLEGPMDGVEAAALIRRQFHLPVIFLTAYSNKDILDRAKVTEPYGYILKPFEDRELHVVIEMARYKHQMDHRLATQYQVSEILSQSDSIEEAVRPLLRAICENLVWEVGLFWTVDRHANRLACKEIWGSPPYEAEEFEQWSQECKYSRGEGLPGRVWGAERMVWDSEFASDSHLPRWSVAARLGLHGAIGFPVRNGAEVVGVMEFIGREIGEANEHLVQMLTWIGNQLSQFIERREVAHFMRVQNHERLIARQIQESLLPKVMPTVPGFKIAGKSLFATAVGGDCFDFMPMRVGEDDCLGIVIGDASGHGVGAALLIAETRAYLRALALTLGEGSTMLTLINHRLTHEVVTDFFVTLLFVSLNPRTNAVVYAGAGHCVCFILDGQGQTKALLTSEGMPLGVEGPGIFPTSSEIILERGDLIVLYTDGVVEACSPEEQPFGVERLYRTVRAHQNFPPAEIIEAIFQAVKDHAQETVRADDATVIILKVEGATSTS